MEKVVSKLKICFFGDVAARHLNRWAKYFADNGHEVHIITFNSNLIDVYDNMKVHIIKKTFDGSGVIFRVLNLIPTLIYIKRLIKYIRPDIVHSHDAGGYAWIGALMEFHPFVVTPWGSDILVHINNSKIEKYFTKYALHECDLITCDGENMKDAIVNLGVSSEKIKFITFGVDIKKFIPGFENESLKKRLFDSDSKIVISTRFLTPIHDVETLIRAVSLVLKDIPSAMFILIGDGDQRDFLVGLSKELGVSENIKFLGRIPEKEIVSYLQAADIYVSTSLSESGLAASTAEAMACELPVVNTNTGDIGLWIKDGEGGFVIPTKKPEILAEKIVYLLKNDEERNKFKINNRKKIEERNNYYKEMEKMEDLYKKLIAQ